MQIATTEPYYEYGRRNGNFNIYTNFKVLHQSWARSESEIENKINNWGHSKDFDKAQYFRFWKDVNAQNYLSFKNFHPLIPSTWPALSLIKGNSVAELQNNLDAIPFPAFTAAALYFRNSRFFSKVRALRNLFYRKSHG
jgi:hypothetical protein